MIERNPYHNHRSWSMPTLGFRTNSRPSRSRTNARWAHWLVLLALSIVVSVQGVAAQGKSAERIAAEPDRSSLVSAAEQAYEEGRFQDVVRLYSRVEKEFGADAKVYRARGSAYEMLNEDRKAVEDYRQSIRTDSADYVTMESLGAIYERHGKYAQDAAALYKEALRLDPRPEWKENLAAWIAMLESRLRPEDASAVGCWHLGNEKARKGEKKEADACYSRSIELNPRLFQAYYSRGVLRLGNGDTAAALADFEQTIRLSPDFAQGFLYRGLALDELGKVKEASEDFERAAGLDPRDPEVLYHLARMLENHADADTGLKLYETALKLRPSRQLASLIRQRLAGLHSAPGPKKRGNSSGSEDQKTLW